MNKEYTLDYLLETFKNHSEEYERNRASLRIKNGEPPYDDSFNLSLAFLVFAKEIKELKERK